MDFPYSRVRDRTRPCASSNGLALALMPRDVSGYLLDADVSLLEVQIARLYGMSIR